MKTREQALRWWIYLENETKKRFCDIYTEIGGNTRHWGSLTGNEIEKIWQKENIATTKRLDEIFEKSNIYLDRLKQQYKEVVKDADKNTGNYRKIVYNAMRLFCLDTQLISFNDIEVMEHEVNNSF